MDRFRTMSLVVVCGLSLGQVGCGGSGKGAAGSGMKSTGEGGVGVQSESASSKAAMEENAVRHEVSAADLAAAKSKRSLESESVVLWVNGLGCPLCASNIDKQLIRVKGVSSVNVDLGQGKVTLGLKAGEAHPSAAVLGEAVLDAGFTLVKVEER